jgi:4a-hydroxytetrahydrobiopterin dehydratase
VHAFTIDSGAGKIIMTPQAKIYAPADIAARLADHPDWSYGEDGQLHAAFTFASFSQTMQFANAVALLAETADHHPDLRIHGYRHLSLDLMTHSAGGITDRDFRLVAAIDGLPRFKKD